MLLASISSGKTKKKNNNNNNNNNKHDHRSTSSSTMYFGIGTFSQEMFIPHQLLHTPGFTPSLFWYTLVASSPLKIAKCLWCDVGSLSILPVQSCSIKSIIHTIIQVNPPYSHTSRVVIQAFIHIHIHAYTIKTISCVHGCINHHESCFIYLFISINHE